MHIAFCSPCSLLHLKDLLDDTTDLPEGYAYPQAALLIREMIQRGHQVSLVTNSLCVSQPKRWSGPNLTIICTPRRKRAIEFLKDLYRTEVRHMRKALLDCQPDIIQANWCYEFADAALSTRIPCVVTIRDSPWRIARMMKHPYRWFRALYSSTFVVPRLKHTVCISQYMQDEFKKLSFYTKSSVIIPNGVPTPKVAPIWSEGPNYKQLLSVTEWNDRKNVKRLLAAFQQSRNAFPDLKLFLYGRGLEPGGPGECWANENNLQEQVCFMGYEQVQKIYSAYNPLETLFISTTLEESFGNIFIEAMSHRFPCLGGKCSGAVPWILNDGACGFLFDAESVESISQNSNHCLEHPSECHVKAELGFQRVLSEFTISSVVDKYLTFYQKILNQNAKL
ncbi:MAG: glycosyltransferase family 4 protein [Verrucomicrobia bacterium]|nr:glycosyltransferase family 4 protein [Verrucomicrobiota bacterium]